MTLAFFNGEFLPTDSLVIPIDERGHQFGDGVYEVIKIYDGTPFLMREHLVRLENSAKAIRLEMPYSIERFEELIQEGLTRAQLRDAQVYVQITRGIATRLHSFPDVPPSTSMTFRPSKSLTEETFNTGIKVALLEDERWYNCYIKSLNLLPNILAKQAAADRGCFEAVLVRDGYITEGSSTNTYAVKDGVVYTHPANKRILNGITRAAVLQVAQESGIEVREEAFTSEFLLAADEAFLTSTTAEVLAITHVDDTVIGTGTPGPVVRQLHAKFRKLIG
ncbi:D-amino-acid transaminase [Tumebacillus permanentifrigoris]|uniref:D-alanine aminotransferase n=1 Tax=Tumebacillus permanentifrigoris TaxID=378543 RepID=A0A316DA61_9BACL|nr:D-amino-acid transaminase [Tumebacillus permanentifrigoris]PWK09039.1 D-alanine transaminase [Tumebacillus permanentifrigoris]